LIEFVLLEAMSFGGETSAKWLIKEELKKLS
jgi:hypothetical protein